MSDLSTAQQVSPESGSSDPAERLRLQIAEQRRLIDASVRLPVLAFITSGVFWLLVGSAFAIVLSIKYHSPDFLAESPFLTLGRLRPVHLNSVAYGWAAMTGVGVIIWLMARLSRVEMRFPLLMFAAALIYNFGLAIGLIGILIGDSTSIEWLELPAYTPPFLGVAFVIVAVVSLINFVQRREPHVYVSQWYIMAALFWFPWLYTATYIMNFTGPVTGIVHASVNWWYAHNVLGLFLTPIGLGTAYYLLPKVLGRPIHSYYLSILGFWSLALFYNWNGAHHLIGGPVPYWLVTVSVVASVMMFIPVITVAINHHMTVVGNFSALKYSPTLRFIVFGAMSYTLVSFQGASQSLRSLNEITHFTHYTIAHAHLGVYSFFSMTMFGAVYYIMPRLTGWEWASSTAIKAHFWLTTVGFIGFYWLPMTIGGVWQGMQMNNPDREFLEIVGSTLWFLQLRSVAGVLMTAGHLIFASLLVMNLLRLGKMRSGPTLLARRPEDGSAPAERESTPAMVTS